VSEDVDLHELELGTAANSMIGPGSVDVASHAWKCYQDQLQRPATCQPPRGKFGQRAASPLQLRPPPERVNAADTMAATETTWVLAGSPGIRSHHWMTSGRGHAPCCEGSQTGRGAVNELPWLSRVRLQAGKASSSTRRRGVYKDVRRAAHDLNLRVGPVQGRPDAEE
jgi:hypothetical protein